MCSARSGKYTDVPRSYASASRALPSRHVVRHVRDVHPEPEVPVRERLDRDRIVEVARVLAVDGDDVEAPEVGAPVQVVLAGVHGALAPPPEPVSRARLGDRRLAVRVRQAVLADDDLVSTPGASRLPSTSTTRPIGPRVAEGQRVMSTATMCAGRRAARLAGRDRDVGLEASVERSDEPQPRRIHVEPPDDR